MRQSAYANLVRRCSKEGQSHSVDAIVMPASRNPACLRFATWLASKLSSPILVLCSGEALAGISEVSAMFTHAASLAVALPRSLELPILQFRSSDVIAKPSLRYVDINTKRNLGLITGRLLGWRRILLLDDDITGLDPLAVGVAAGHLLNSDMRLVGWRSIEFPDNSVVRHARRALGHDTGVFLGGAALLVDLEAPLSFFPPAVSNGDWLFMHDAAVGAVLGEAGEVRQLPYDPFATPGRAYGEEFGELLAEGLFQLVANRTSVLVACVPAYWEAVLKERRSVLIDTFRRIDNRRANGFYKTTDGYALAQVSAATRASLEALEGITTRRLADFTIAWRYDLYLWRSNLLKLPQFAKTRDALNLLRLSNAVGQDGQYA
jgi:hypothetical protein